ncbi:unnamed protein product [Victoria cruziana]
MNQDDLGAAAAPASADFLLAKRKRGRPRKDENFLNSDNASVVGRVRRRRRKADSTYSDNAMVGQIVSGVLDGSFDSGYLLTVRVGDTHTVLRGVVFEPGRSVPVTAANDVAPHVKMFQRAEVAIPVNEQCNLTTASIHVLQPVFKGDRSTRRLHKNDPSHQHKISPNDVRKEEAAQTEKCSDQPSQKQATFLTEKALENDSCKLLFATSQSAEVDTKTTRTVDTSKNEATLPEGQSHEVEQSPLTTSESENGSCLKKRITDDTELAQLKQSHNDVKEASDGIGLAQAKRLVNEENEVPVATQQVLLSKVKIEDVPKELTVPLRMELHCDANEESRPLKTDIKKEKLDPEPQDAVTSQKFEDVPSLHEPTEASEVQWARETTLPLDGPDTNEVKEVISRALDINSDTKRPLLQIHPQLEDGMSMGVSRAIVHDSFSVAKTDKVVDTMKFGDDCAMPKTESASQSGVETPCETSTNVHPADGTDQLSEIGMLKDEKFADSPVVESILSPKRSASVVSEESLLPDVETASQAVARNHGDEIDDPQGLQFIAVKKPVVAAEDPLFPDVETTNQAVPSNHRNEIVDPRGLQFMAIVKPVVVPEEPTLPDRETSVGAVASNQGTEIHHAYPNQVLQDSYNPLDLPPQKPPLSQEGILSDDVVMLEASKDGNFGGWEEVIVESCQPREEAAKVSSTGVNMADHP